MIYIRKKRTIHTFFFLFHMFSRPSYLTRCRGSKLALLHRVKERKTPSLSAQASFAHFSLKVAWCGKSLIVSGFFPCGAQAHVSPVTVTVDGKDHSVHYCPGESDDSEMFGGNSNWRGPVWICREYHDQNLGTGH